MMGISFVIPAYRAVTPFSALLLAASLACAAPTNPRSAVSLDGDSWRLTGCAVGDGERTGLQLQAVASLQSMPVTVPNDVQLTGFVKDSLGELPDLIRVNSKEWWYTRRFASPKVESGQQTRLILEGVDYFADVWLNGVKLGSHEGAYTRFEFDITDRLAVSGDNYLAIRVTAPWKVAGRSHYEFMKGEYEETWDALPGPGEVVFPLGLHRSVRLEVTSPARINELSIWTVNLKDGVAELASSLQLANRGGATTGAVEVTIRPENFTGSSTQLAPRNVSLPAQSESTMLKFTFEVKDPQLWWTWDLGAQNLYRADAVLIDSKGHILDSSSTVFGIRTLERDAGLLYRINGRPLFMRGAWYPMSKLYPASTDKWTYEKDLRLARNANMNHLVNYTVVEKDEFYELADRLGILLFMELPFNQEGPLDALNAAYPRRSEFIEWSSGQVRQIIRELSNHPSVGVWAPVSEVTVNGQNFGTSWDPRLAEAADGYALFLRAMEAVVKEEDHDALFFRSYCDFGEHHFWEGTFATGSTYDKHFDATTDFVSEYGALGLFPLENASRVVDPGKVWHDSQQHWSSVSLPIHSASFSYLQPYQYFGLDFLTASIGGFVTRKVESLRDYVNASQIYQAFLYGYAGDAYRRKSFAPINGVRSWMFKSFPEIPIGGFGVIDAYDTPTRAYYEQKRTFESVTMSFAFRTPLESVAGGLPIHVPVWISNISGDALSEIQIEYALYDLKGNALQSMHTSASVAAYHAQQVSEVDWEAPSEPGIYFLRGHALGGGKILASGSSFVKVSASVTRKPLRVLVAGSPEWANPVAEYLTGLGAKVTLGLSENTVVRPLRFPASGEELARDYDVIWLAGYDNYWREAPPEVTTTIMDAVRTGTTFVHTGSPASFHGGGEKTAGLDLTPLAELMPVKVNHENDVFLKTSYRAGKQPNELASHDVYHLHATERAPNWVQEIPLENLAPDSFHMLAAKPESQVLIKIDDLPLLVAGNYGKGKTLAYMGFSPEGSQHTAHDPIVLDRAIRESSQDRLFAMMSATIIALASGSNPSAGIASLMEQREQLLFESLLEYKTVSAPNISTAWTTDSDGRTVGHVRIENGNDFTFGFRVRLDGPDEHNGSTLPLWSEQYFNLLPHEVAESTVTLWRPQAGTGAPSWIIGETVAGAETRYPGPQRDNSRHKSSR